MRKLCLLASLACLSCRTPPPHPPRADSMERLVREGKVMDLRELTQTLRGARAEGRTLAGHGLTVFEGAKVERFDIEVLDIMRNFIYPKHDLILFRASHKRWLDGGNVIGGMSGSPCYVNGKLIGAVAYRLGAFQKEPLGGITPIEYMVREMDRPVEQARANGDPTGPVPVQTPLLATRFRPRSLDVFREFFDRDHYVMARSAGGSAVQEAGDKLEPGGAIGAALMTGDYDLTAIGTVTFVEDDRVLAFGHPFFQAGEIEMPITTAVIHTTFQGVATAYKIGSTGKVVGALVHDRTNAIFGRIGKAARMVPAKLTVRNPKVQTEQTVEVEILDHPTYLPTLLSMIVFDVADTFEPSAAPHVTSSTVTVTLKGGRTLRFTDIDQFMPAAGFFALASSPTAKVLQLVRNEHERPVVERIEVVTEIVNEQRSAALKHAWVPHEEVADGGTVRIQCVLQRYRGPELTREVEVKLPRGLKKGTEVSILVGGGDAIAPERAPASTLDEFLDALEKEYRATSLVAVATLPSYNLMHKGKILDRMPNSILAELVPTIDETAYLAHAGVRASVDTEWVITGSQSLKVRIK